ncbi:MAG: isocitrate lyase/phosphoenolpyruvate mutase family protein [Acidobacteriota bacterium]|nr:isocitrate lyase/phosphoenolpyruvate mutase family protein [Acidobacteriota bacterium]
MTQSEKAKIFRELHRREPHGSQPLGKPLLLLPNAWDVASARVFEEAGFPAIGTTSAGIAAVFGYPDGQHISRELMLEMVRRIVQSVAVPVTADVEAGYNDPLLTAVKVMEAGAVGINLEDLVDEQPATLVGLSEQVAVIRSIRAQTNLVINARTDIFLAGIGDTATRLERTLERLNAYCEAGADCLFAPGVRDAETIGKLARSLKGPLNILAVAGTPPIAELQRLGVARVSIGSGAMRATLGLARRVATELREHGTYSAMVEGAISYAEVNSMLGTRTL